MLTDEKVKYIHKTMQVWPRAGKWASKDILEYPKNHQNLHFFPNF